MLQASVEPPPSPATSAAMTVAMPKKLYELKYIDVGIAAVISGFAFSLGAALFELAKAKVIRKR